MKEKVLRALYDQLMFHSENGTLDVKHPWFCINEAAKCSGVLQREARKSFYAFEKQGLIKVIDDGQIICRLTASGTNTEMVERAIHFLSKPDIYK